MIILLQRIVIGIGYDKTRSNLIPLENDTDKLLVAGILKPGGKI